MPTPPPSNPDRLVLFWSVVSIVFSILLYVLEEPPPSPPHLQPNLTQPLAASDHSTPSNPHSSKPQGALSQSSIPSDFSESDLSTRDLSFEHWLEFVRRDSQ